MARAPKLPPPVYDPADVAEAILYAAEHGLRDLHVGGGGEVMSSPRKRAPSVTDWMGATAMSRTQKDTGPAGPDRDGALYAAGRAGAVRGAYMQAAINPVLAGIVLAGATAAAASLLSRSARPGSDGRNRDAPKCLCPDDYGRGQPLFSHADHSARISRQLGPARARTEGLILMHLKMLAATASIVGGLGLASAGAAPLTPAAAGTLTGPAAISTVAFGCGPGWAPGPYGRCRPIYRRPRFYGPRCFFRPTPFGPRRVCRY